jgi:2'-5' RNA ligase
MTYAIELFFDAPSETRIFSLWDTFAGFGAPSMRSGDQRPHVTLAVADSVDLSATRQLLDSFALALKPFSISFAALGLFPSSERVAFLAPKNTPELLALHERFFFQFSSVAQSTWSHYAPASWIPHCTLTVGLATEQLSSAFDAVHSFGLPLDCTAVEIGLVEFFPVKQLHVASFVR